MTGRLDRRGTLAKAYNPYGAVTSTSGSSASSYGFTNEYQSQGKIYLRARHYMPSIGRFLTRDTWGGNANSPMSFNHWAYVQGNPISRTDPSGLCWIIDENDEDGRWYPDSDYRCYLQKQKPWYAMDTIKNTRGAQNWPHPDGDPEFPPYYYNLCGHFALKIVIEAITGTSYGIQTLIDDLDTWECTEGGCQDYPIDLDQLARLATKSIGNRARVISYSGSQINEFELDENGKVRLYYRNMHTRKWYGDGNMSALAEITSLLNRGYYLIVLGILNTANGTMANHIEKSPDYVGHWVTVQEIFGDTIRIVNPAYNRIEQYSWKDVFRGSMSQMSWKMLAIKEK